MTPCKFNRLTLTRERLSACLLCGLLAASANAATIPDVPLLTSTAAPPNIMMILDDSGSMQWEMLPDDVTYFSYTFPRVSGVYGGDDYDNNVASFENNNVYNAFSRSPQVNKVYYNPAVTYRPWSNSDGSLMVNAASNCAPHNPVDLGLGCRNLTSNNTQTASWYRTTGWDNRSLTFWPAVYFRHNGGANTTWANYTKFEIRSSTTTYTGEGRNNRSDCANAVSNTCTYAEEIQNFANWYTYYRSRVLTARAGIGRAFAAQSSNLRPGFAAINKGSTTVDDVSSTTTVIRGVRDFSGTNRTNFFSNLYDHPIPKSNTPLRYALNNVGKYYSRTDDKGPWSTTPGFSGGTDLTCRQSYSILMTDGYWNGDEASTSGARKNNDGTGGPTITGPNSQTYTYSATSPFADTHENTLADVAMYYWKRDLRTDLENGVSTNYLDPAFWQHMVTFGVGLGVTGTIDPIAAFKAIDTGASITWPDPTSSNSALLDDLLHASVNSRGGFFSAADPEEFATALTNTLNDIVKRTGSASNVSTNSTSINTGSQVFQAKFESGKWNGDLDAIPVTASGTGATPNWKASEQIPAPAGRNILTMSGGIAKAFSWSAPLSTTDQTALGSADVVDYVRGVRSKELQNGGGFRNRSSNNILGDIVHSSPYYVKDSNTVFVGANDGMLHAFDAGSGKELFAYIPSAVIPNLQSLSQPSYTHKYFVDGDIAVSNLSQTAGKNYLVSTLGLGGKGLFGLNVTTPSSFGTSHVLWEYSNASDVDLGYMLGQPLITKMNDGKWAVIIGNGYNSTSGKAVLYIFELATGNLIRKIDTTIAGDNGLATPGFFDADGNGTVDFIYAGDLKGNVWKFDVSNSTPASWNIAFSSQPFYTAKDPNNVPQPITAPIILAKNDLSGDPNFGKHFVFFGTGSYFRSADPINTQVNSWYGLIDDNNVINADKSELMPRSIAEEGVFNGTQVRTFNAATAGDMSGKKGWYINFSTKSGERIVTASELKKAAKPVLTVSSIIPVVDPCVPSGKGFVNSINPFSGAGLDFGFFDINNNGIFTDDILNGRFIGGFDPVIGMPSKAVFIGPRIVVGGSSGQLKSFTINLGINALKGRISWREIIRD
ncbi:MAG: pilus assembly protein [Rhodoferax sp.]